MKRLFTFVIIILSLIVILTSCTLFRRHNPKAVKTYEPTCAAMGYTEYACKHCDEKYVADFVDAAGHTFGDGVAIIEEDCTTRGVYESSCLRCGEMHRYSVSAKGHSYVEISNDGSTVGYECEVCHDVVNVASDEILEDYISATEIFDVDPTFTFNIVSSEDEGYIKENLKIIDSYFYGSEYENDPDANVDFTLTSNGNGVWTVYANTDYIYDTTYLARLSGSIRFEEYRGREISFTVIGDPDHENEYEYRDGIVFLKSLIGDMSYQVNSGKDGGSLYLVFDSKVDVLSKGQILCIGDIESLEEINSDTECYFGVVDSIYPLSDGKWAVTLAEPELQTIFSKLDIAFNDEVTLDGAGIDTEEVKNDIIKSLYASEEFVEFLSAVKVSSERYIGEQGYYSSSLLDTQNFLNGIQINPNVSFSGNKIVANIDGSISIDIKNSSSQNIGTLTIGFNFDIESQLKIDVNYDIKAEWKGIKLEKFDVAMTQTDKIGFGFRVSVDCDELVDSGYVINKNSGEAHLACCIEVTRANDASLFERISKEEAIASNKKCEHCKPEDGASLEKDFNSFYMNTLYCSDWEKVASDIAKLTSNEKDLAKVNVTLGSVEIPICGPVRVNIDLGIALTFDARAIMDYSYSYTQRSVYGMRLNHSFIQPYSQMSNENIEESDISVLGTLEARVGLFVDSHVNISGFEKWINAGVKAELGGYAELNGVLDAEREYVGAYLEIGAYLDIDAYYKLIKKDDSVDVAEIKRALAKYGYERLYFGFDRYYDVITINCSLDIDESNILAVRYFDLVNMVIKSDELSLAEKSKYKLNISFADGRYCEIRDGRIVARSGVPEVFSDTLIITVTSNGDWKSYRKGSALYYLGTYTIDLNFDMTQGHMYGEPTKITDSTCLVEGEIRNKCMHCDYVHVEKIEKLSHDWQYVAANDITVCQNCNSMKYNEHIYKIFTNASTWDSAKVQCEAIGGHLATITSAEEQGAIERYLIYLSFTNTFWTGGYKETGQWKWITGESFEYSKWNSGEPNNSGGNEDKLHMNHYVLAGWNDISHTNAISYLCEWEAE